jgi:hypothetical protein
VAGKEPKAQSRPVVESRTEPIAAGVVVACAPVRSTHAEARVPLGPPDVVLDAKASGGGQLLAPNVLSVKHWDRLLGGMLYAASPRVDWASLLRRSFEVDVLACPGCGGRLRVLGEVTDRAMVRVVLDSLGMPTDAPCVARARDPTEWLGEHVVA